jgi:transcriptional regulator
MCYDDMETMKEEAHYMDLEKLHAFLVLTNTGSFTRAADELFISQPALSKQIQSLENELKVPLFNRTKKHSSLTIYGEYLRPYASNILANYRNAREHIRQIERLDEGSLRFGATNFIGVYLLPPCLAAFHKHCPGITLDMTINSSRKLIQMLENYELEFILLSDYISIDEERYIVEPWQADTLYVTVAPSHPLGQRASIRTTELNREVFIIKDRSSSIYKFLHQKLVPFGLSLERPLFISHQEAIKQATMHGIGISILPEKSIILEKAAGLLCTIALDETALTRNIVIVREKERHLTPAAQEFLTLLRRMNFKP